MVTLATARVLARCNGFTVVADDLLVRVADATPGTYLAIPPALITDADAESRTLVAELG